LSVIFFITLFLVFTTSSPQSTCNSHFSESNIAIGLVAGIFQSTIFIITIRGTDNNIPTIPQILPQNHNETIITSGLKFNLLPINLGSIIFHINTCIPISVELKSNELYNQNSGWTNENITTNQTAIIDQILGIKFKINIINPQNTAKFNQKINMAI